MRPAFLGLLMLDTRFPRPLGDVGHPGTFERAGIPLRCLTIAGASPQRIVRTADPAWAQPFVDGAVALAAEGAALVSTSCGFLAAYQDVLARAVPVPVLSSSLLQVARYRRPGIVTIDADALTPAILRAAGVPAGTPVQGVAAGCELQRRILGNEPTLDMARAEQDVVTAALALVRAHPLLTDVVLECTNMPPYRAAVARATGRPVHDLETLLLAEWAALQRT